MIREWRGVAFDELGSVVRGVGDVDGDGVPDVAVQAGRGSSGGEYVDVYTGRDGSLLYRLSGGPSFTAFGRSLAGPGDLNGDGYADLLVGAPYEDASAQDAGRVRLYSGKDAQILRTMDGGSAGDYFGGTLDGIGDVNGDSIPDFLIGARGDDRAGQEAGAAFVYSGADGKILFTLLGDRAGHWFGMSCAGAGDVDDDGVPDFLVGAPKDDQNGSWSGLARVFSGRDGSTLYDLRGSRSYMSLGNAVDGAGDFDADGHADLVVGAPGTPSKIGWVFVYSGSTGQVLRAFSGRPGAMFGADVAGVGDVNGDGIGEILVGAFNDDANGVATGSAHVFDLTASVELYDFLGPSTEQRFGNSVDAAGDVDGDGLADLLVGAAYDSVAGYRAGRAVVYSGNDLWLNATPTTVPAGGSLDLDSLGGPPLATAGLFLTGINGQPVQILVGIGRLDRRGRWSVSQLVPPGLSGNGFTFQSFACCSRGGRAAVIDSSPETVWVR